MDKKTQYDEKMIRPKSNPKRARQELSKRSQAKDHTQKCSEMTTRETLTSDVLRISISKKEWSKTPVHCADLIHRYRMFLMFIVPKDPLFKTLIVTFSPHQFLFLMSVFRVVREGWPGVEQN